MRRLLVLIIGVHMLALPAGAGALKSAPGDGTLVVDNALGFVTMTVRGGIIGRFDSGTIEIFDPVPGDGPPPVVRGATQRERLGPRRIAYTGDTDVRFRLIGGVYKVRITAIGIDVSAVGRGSGVLDGSGFSDQQTGRYSLNGGLFQAMPGTATRFTLGTTAPATPGLK
jgi:hypothetical protein